MTDSSPLAAGHTSAGPAHPSDHAERHRALDPAQSFLVQAPAGSGKTYLLTQRFLRLLAQAERPDEIVAITFTNAAAAEMRNRILGELEAAAKRAEIDDADPESLPALAARALKRDSQKGWQILDLPNQLRITTIDAFCRVIALQSPLSWGMLSGLGGQINPTENAGELYRQAARRTLELLHGAESPTRQSVEALLLWRDNYWRDVEDLLAQMLAGRNRWQSLVFGGSFSWPDLRLRLEAPFRRAARAKLMNVRNLLDRLPGSGEYALKLARLACETPGKSSPIRLAGRAELPVSFAPEDGVPESAVLDDATEAHSDLARFLLTTEGEWRKPGGLNKNHGFPTTPPGKAAKERFGEFVDSLAQEPGLCEALAGFLKPGPVQYSDDEWDVIRHCFALLREATGQLQVVFAETGSVDFIEVAQIALRILAEDDGSPSDFAMRLADSIRHLLVDEFQDTSRNQHLLLSRLISAWPEREGRSCFCVGDPMQSIYGFREAEVELFERLKSHGLETQSDPDSAPFRFEFLQLRSNFRTAPSLVDDLNGHFSRIFAAEDGSGVGFTSAIAAREADSGAKAELHLAFTREGKSLTEDLAPGDPETTRQELLSEIVALIRDHLETMARVGDAADETGKAKYRIAVLGRTKNSLVRVAEVLREAGIGFRAVDLVPLRERSEVLDALSLARALLNPADRTAWLGVLRAPWCGLSLAELHLIISADDEEICAASVPQLLASRLPALHQRGLIEPRAFAAASRVARVLDRAAQTRASGSALGTWLESVWKALGGEATVNAEQHENLRLLWSALDKLPEGELDLAGPGLDAVLDQLFALPDPAASGDFGVQLMTIHKSKGLEFEVVIVPDLEAKGKTYERTMMSWLERGVADPDSEEPTEFLIGPIQSKGEEAGPAKAWVDRIKREREIQEMRRLLYVAATRAREELHLFTRPRFKESLSADGQVTRSLSNATGLLNTAWPTLGEEIAARFADWDASLAAAPEAETAGELIESLAAEAAGNTSEARTSNLLQMPAHAQPSARPTMLRRLPESLVAPEFPVRSSSASARVSDLASPAPYARTEGGLESRLLGTAIHALLEQASRLRLRMTPGEAAQGLASTLPAIVADIRGKGLPRTAAERLANQALEAAQRASLHPVGAWILSPHPGAEAESRWTGLIGTGTAPGQQRNLRPDRVFFAAGMGTTTPVWWVIDYKTSDGAGADLRDETAKQAFLSLHREQYADQLAIYAQMLRGLHGLENTPVRAGIYYPLLTLLDSWEL